MGEPLMYKHFEEILQICREFGVKLNLTTNGSFFGRGATEWAKLIAPLASDVKISWNGATQATQEAIMKGSKYATQLSNLKAFLAVRDEIANSGGNRCSVTLQLTFMEVNLPEILEIVKLGVSLGVDRIKGHHLWAHFKEIKEENLRRSSDSIVRWNAVVLECQQYSKENKLPNGKQIKLDNFFTLESEAALQGVLHPEAKCPFLGQEAWINHKGRFDPCCAPDEQRLFLGSFGNVNDRSLLDIWRSDSYHQLIQGYLKNPLCQTCNMRKPPSS